MYWLGVRPIDREAKERDLWIIDELIDAQKVILFFPTGHRDPENKTPIEIGIAKIIKKHKEDIIVLPVELVNTHKLNDNDIATVIIKEPFLTFDIPNTTAGTFELLDKIATAINVPMPERKRRRVKEGVE